MNLTLRILAAGVIALAATLATARAAFVGSGFFDVMSRPSDLETKSKWTGSITYAGEQIRVPMVGGLDGPFTALDEEFTGQSSTVALTLSGQEWWQYVNIAASSADEMFPSKFGSSSAGKAVLHNQVDTTLFRSKGWRPAVRLGRFNVGGTIVPYASTVLNDAAGNRIYRAPSSLSQTYFLLEWQGSGQLSSSVETNWFGGVGYLKEEVKGAIYTYTSGGFNYGPSRVAEDSGVGARAYFGLDAGWGKRDGIMLTWSTVLRYDFAFYDGMVVGSEVGLNWSPTKNLRLRGYVGGYFTLSQTSVFGGDRPQNWTGAQLDSLETTTFGLQVGYFW